MFQESIIDATEAIDEMNEILQEVANEAASFAETARGMDDSLKELEAGSGTSLSRKLRLVQNIKMDLEEFSDAVDLVAGDLSQRHDRLIQTLGDVLLACDIDDRTQMRQFRSLLSKIKQSLGATARLSELGDALEQLYSNLDIVSDASRRSVVSLNQELARTESVFTRMIHLSEYFQ